MTKLNRLDPETRPMVGARPSLDGNGTIITLGLMLDKSNFVPLEPIFAGDGFQITCDVDMTLEQARQLMQILETQIAWAEAEECEGS